MKQDANYLLKENDPTAVRKFLRAKTRNTYIHAYENIRNYDDDNDHIDNICISFLLICFLFSIGCPFMRIEVEVFNCREAFFFFDVLHVHKYLIRGAK